MKIYVRHQYNYHNNILNWCNVKHEENGHMNNDFWIEITYILTPDKMVDLVASY